MMYRDEYRDRRDDIIRDLDSSRYLPPPRDLYYDDRLRGVGGGGGGGGGERSYSDFDDLDRKRYSLSLDDSYYRHLLDDLDPPPPRRGRLDTHPPPLPPLQSVASDDATQDTTTGVVLCGSVIVIPASPFDRKPSLRPKPAVCTTVFVGSLPDNASNKHLQELFGNCGRVLDVRVSKGRNFGHVQFEKEEEVEKALQLSGCRVRIGPSSTIADTSKIHVDYAQPRSESEISKRVEATEPLSYNGPNAGMISADLHGEDTFWAAAKNVKLWIERGNCNASTTSTFFGLISSCNTHSRKISKRLRDLEKEDKEYYSLRKSKYDRFLKECKVVKDVLVVACGQKTAWDGFTKPQRKSISQWKDSATTLAEEMQAALEGRGNFAPIEPSPSKKIKLVSPEQTPAYETRIEELKKGHTSDLRKRDTQIMQLNTLIAQFKKKFPSEWERAIGGGSSKEEIKMEEEAGDPLAAEAVAYAKLRSVLGTTATEETKTSEFSESEVAIITVLSTFLTVNPLGATIEEITTYFNKYNPSISAVYLESLLHRLPQVFQLSQSSPSDEDTKKWWFLGFQTCCSQGQYAAQNSGHTTETDGENSASSPTN